jgi:hypothetical protein
MGLLTIIPQDVNIFYDNTDNDTNVDFFIVRSVFLCKINKNDKIEYFKLYGSKQDYINLDYTIDKKNIIKINIPSNIKLGKYKLSFKKNNIVEYLYLCVLSQNTYISSYDLKYQNIELIELSINELLNYNNSNNAKNIYDDNNITIKLDHYNDYIVNMLNWFHKSNKLDLIKCIGFLTYNSNNSNLIVKLPDQNFAYRYYCMLTNNNKSIDINLLNSFIVNKSMIYDSEEINIDMNNINNELDNKCHLKYIFISDMNICDLYFYDDNYNVLFYEIV